MCGISGVFNTQFQPVQALEKKLKAMNQIQKHRGPDGEGLWMPLSFIGFSHQRLSIIDIAQGHQPMVAPSGNAITYNGEIYNYKEIKAQLTDYPFRTNSDTEVLLAAYEKWGQDCLHKLRGMFSFAIWDARKKELFCARDHFGIKPFYYKNNGDFVFASEAKTLLPFFEEVVIDKKALSDYLHFQLYLNGRTLYKDIKELQPGHKLIVKDGKIHVERYWEVYYNLDFNHTKKYFEEKLEALLVESIKLHTVSDVPISSYISGGIDSSLVAAVACQNQSDRMLGFTGKFSREGELFDESSYARSVARNFNIDLIERDITAQDFQNNIEKVLYHLDYPVAGPGSFPQFMISETVSKHRKVVLGGQGGDEIFGGYTRYLIAYFEQCIKGAIDGTLDNGNFVVTYESIINNLQSLGNYKPLIKEFFSKGLFESLDKRYYHLINRSPSLQSEINWDYLDGADSFASFHSIFNGDNVGKESYFDKMTHFDFKTLLPALLQVEDRMSMAHGIESRVPFLHKEIVEFAATMPADIKFKDGNLKMILVNTMQKYLPREILERKNKMGFPVPLNGWIKNELKDFIHDVFSTQKFKTRDYVNPQKVLLELQNEGQFSRKAWGLLSLELWHRQFLDNHYKFKELIN
ncbi:asparagine synthase (glutamine-hydrolyzing) [bacterium]|nr:asparagine synthase (glutamine-hydrolyzing) [bacterium]